MHRWVQIVSSGTSDRRKGEGEAAADASYRIVSRAMCCIETEDHLIEYAREPTQYGGPCDILAVKPHNPRREEPRRQAESMALREKAVETIVGQWLSTSECHPAAA
jgi:hypothetical protein